MTSSRIVRSTKGRIFLYVCAAVFVTGLIACYNNVRIQLEEVQQSYSICLRDHSDFTKEISDLQYKTQRLEKSLDIEKNEHIRTKTEYENQKKEDTLKNDKTLNEAKLRFNSLQQHYNLLQTQHDDFKDECSKIQREQLDSINQLQSKLQEVQAQVKLLENEREDNVEHLKVQNDALNNENRKLKEQLNLQKTRPEVSSTVANKVISPSIIENNSKLKEKSKKPIIVNENDNVLPVPKEESAVSKVIKSTPKSISMPDLIGAQPLISPSSTPETKKSSVKTPNMILPLPYQQVPQGVVPVHDDNLIADESRRKNEENFSMNKYRNNILGHNVDLESKNDKTLVDHNLNEIVDNDNANEEFDLPNNNNNQGNPIRQEENLLQKPQPIEELNAVNGRDEMDYEQQNGLDADEDDTGDGIPMGHPDEAIRN